MCPFQVVNPGHLEITQLNLEGHKPEESAHLEFLCPLPKEMKEMILMMIMKYLAYWPCQICACMAAYIGSSQS